MKIYTAINILDENIKYFGSMRKIAKDIGVSANAISKAYNNDKPCKGFDILFCVNYKQNKRLTQKEKLHKTIEVLKRARIIIDEQNSFLCENNEYPNINILNEIDRCLNYYKI